jgi:hypothetical protein
MNFISSLIHYDYSTVIFWWKIIAGLASALFVVGIAYAVWRTQEVFATLRGSPKNKAVMGTALVSQRNIDMWSQMLARAASDDENERKLAIISVDSLVDKILGLSGYQGENLGERLKKIEPSDLDSLNDIWEAHKVRNRIAHEPDLKLSHEESVNTLRRYEKVLKELRYLQ